LLPKIDVHIVKRYRGTKTVAIIEPAGIAYGEVNSRQKAIRVVVAFVAIVGALLFVGDVLNPATATPVIWPRVLVFARLVFAMIRLLVPFELLMVCIEVCGPSAVHGLQPEFIAPRRILDFGCVQLR
jgi:hypothetical protein